MNCDSIYDGNWKKEANIFSQWKQDNPQKGSFPLHSAILKKVYHFSHKPYKKIACMELEFLQRVEVELEVISVLSVIQSTPLSLVQ